MNSKHLTQNSKHEMLNLSPEEQEKQERYKNARTSDWYDDIWKTVGKCVFCDLREKYILFEENDIVMTISLYPYIDGHFMIVPRQHVKSPKDLSSSQWETVREFTYLAKKMIKKITGIKSMQLVYKDGENAQGTVNGHMHIHCIPFDAPDLSVWNYRKLEYSPLENVARYKSIVKDIIKSKLKFKEKYGDKMTLSIVCDVLIQNTKGEYLFQERKDEFKYHPDILTLPGGHINSSRSTLQKELQREVEEEIGIKIDISKLKLLDSRIDTLKQIKISPHLRVKYPSNKTFLWNTYELKEPVNESDLQPGDDTQTLIWLSKEEIIKREDVTEEIKDLIEQLPLKSPSF